MLEHKHTSHDPNLPLHRPAFVAEPKHLGGVPGEGESVLVGYFACPAFDRAAIDFHGAAAFGAHKVMVVGFRGACAVEGFPAGHVQHVYGVNVSSSWIFLADAK